MMMGRSARKWNWFNVAWICCGLVLQLGCQSEKRGAPPTTEQPSKTKETHWQPTEPEKAETVAYEQRVLRPVETGGGFVHSTLDAHIDARLQVTQARVDIEDGAYESALGRLDQIRLTEPVTQTAAYHRLRGQALTGLERWSDAGLAFKQAYRADPTIEHLTAWMDALIAADELDMARLVLEQERVRFPGHPNIHTLAARLGTQMVDVQAAIREMVAAAVAQPGAFEVRRRLTETYALVGHYDAAIAGWRDLIAHSRTPAERHRYRRHLAGCLVYAGRYEEARQTYDLMLMTRPEDLEARLGLAAASLAVGETGAALERALEVLERDEQSVDGRIVAALAYERIGRKGEARALLSSISYEEDPDGLVAELARSLE